MKVCDCIATIIVVFLIVAKSDAIRCHEGLNVTVGGIPMYMWVEHDCKENENCLIQEMEFREKIGKVEGVITIRFGGCFSQQMMTVLSCKTAMLYRVKLEEFRQLFATFDEKVVALSTTILEKREQYEGKILSRGNNVKEFYAGVLHFLETLGYDAMIIQVPLYQFMDRINKNESDISAIGKQLLDAMSVKNPATTRLSAAIRKFVSRYSHHLADGDRSETPSDHVHAFILSSLPGLSYPLLNTFTTSDTNHIFNVLSGTIESADHVPPMSDSVTVSLWLFFVQVGIAGMYNNVTETFLPLDVVHNISKEVLTRLREAHPDNTDIRFVAFMSDGIYDFAQKNKDYCLDDLALCNTRFVFFLQSFVKKFDAITNNKDPNKVIADLINDVIAQQFEEQGTDDGSNLQSILRSVFLTNPDKYTGRWFSHVFNKTEGTLKNILDLLSNPLFRDIDEELLLRKPCEEYKCDTDLCNSHEAFDRQMKLKQPAGRQPSVEL